MYVCIYILCHWTRNSCIYHGFSRGVGKQPRPPPEHITNSHPSDCTYMYVCIYIQSHLIKHSCIDPGFSRGVVKQPRPPPKQRTNSHPPDCTVPISVVVARHRHDVSQARHAYSRRSCDDVDVYFRAVALCRNNTCKYIHIYIYIYIYISICIFIFFIYTGVA